MPRFRTELEIKKGPYGSYPERVPNLTILHNRFPHIFPEVIDSTPYLLSEFEAFINDPGSHFFVRHVLSDLAVPATGREWDTFQSGRIEVHLAIAKAAIEQLVDLAKAGIIPQIHSSKSFVLFEDPEGNIEVCGEKYTLRQSSPNGVHAVGGKDDWMQALPSTGQLVVTDNLDTLPKLDQRKLASQIKNILLMLANKVRNKTGADSQTIGNALSKFLDNNSQVPLEIIIREALAFIKATKAGTKFKPNWS